MLWIAYSLLSMLTAVVREITQKRALQDEPTIEYLTVRNCILLVVSILLVPFATFTLSLEAYAFILATAVLLTGALIHRNRALKTGDISVIEPLLNVQPVFVAIIAFLWLGEALTPVQLTGIAAIVLGTYWLETDQHDHTFTHTVEKLWTDVSARHLLIAALLLAGSNTVTRHILTTYTDYISYFILTFTFTTVFLLIASASEYSFNSLGHVLEEHGWEISIPAVLTVIGCLALYKALSLANAGLVIALFSTKSVLTALEGGQLFHEQHLHKRVTAGVVTTIGAVLVVL